MMSLKILHTNDMHGALTPGRAEALAKIRNRCDLYFDSGDAIKTGNLGIPLRPEPVWEELARLECTASVLGNRETHIVEPAFRAKLNGVKHPVLCGNMHRKDNIYPLPRTLELTIKGVRIGVVSTMVPMVTEKMKTQAASSYLWDDPIQIACQLAADLRPRVDLLLALTHIGHRQDLVLANTYPSFDAILGGHSHTVLSKPEKVGTTWVCQGGSHCRYVGIYEWSLDEGWTGSLETFPT
jgi:2',3'-cyclic-nucleotide 2'-phosphodiesterase (5'-nucleotidase family)